MEFGPSSAVPHAYSFKAQKCLSGVMLCYVMLCLKRSVKGTCPNIDSSVIQIFAAMQYSNKMNFIIWELEIKLVQG
jgi:hypothetical protein